MADNRRGEDRQRLETLTAEFLARGGQIESCPPGPSETVVYKNRPMQRRNNAARSPVEAKPAEG